MCETSCAERSASRVRRLRELMGERGLDAMVVRELADLRWLTNVDGVLDEDAAHTVFVTADELFLHTDSRYYNAFCERLGTNGIWQLDQETLSAGKWVAERIAASAAHKVAIEDTLPLSIFDELVEALGSDADKVELVRLHGDLRVLRMVKDDDEIEFLREAQRITDAAFEYVCSVIRPGMTERQIRGEIESFMLKQGSDGPSFSTIVAAGANGANPHACPSDYAVREGDLIVLDYGALCHGYHADMTRTVCVGEPSERQRQVYDIVRRAHEECTAMLRPGINGKEVHEHSRKVISDAGFGDYYGHGLGHGVGIEIHEFPGLGRSWDKPVPAGSVVTVEPGIYLPGEFGIRLEDCGVLTEEGYKPFTALDHELRVVGV